MKSAALPKLNKILRKPWYLFWNLVEKRLYEKHDYVLHIPYGHRIFAPWFDVNSKTDFIQILEMVRKSGPLIVSPDRCYILYQFARRSANLPGDMAECGVYKGGTAQFLAQTLTTYGSNSHHLHLFDTFSGMPETAVPERDYHSPKDFSDTSIDYVRKRLQNYHSVCIFHSGFMPDSFVEVADIPLYSFVHVDVDIYLSTLSCCEWFWPRLCSGGVMIVNDYGFYPYRLAAHKAVNEYFAGRLEQPIVLPTGQAIVVKL